MAMDAGKFNFNNMMIGGAKPLQSTPQTKSAPKESPAVQPEPMESFQFGSVPLRSEAADILDESSPEIAQAAPQAPVAVPSSIPSQVGDFLIAGVGSIGLSNSVSQPSFDGLTALNGLSSTSLQSLGGSNVASVNPLNPKTPTKMPTTSLDLVNGLESTMFTTTSGRAIGL